MKHLSILLATCIAVFATSCEPSEDTLETYATIAQNYTVVDSEGNASIFPERNFYYEINLTEGNVDITLHNVKFSPKMPVEITMTIDDVPLVSTQTGGYKFKGANIVPEVNDEEAPAYTITSITGDIYPMLSANGYGCKLTFVVNNRYTVNAYSSPMLFDQKSSTTVIQNPLDSYLFAYDKSYTVISINEEASTAQINLFNIKFAENMPMALNLIFKDVPVTVTQNGIELNCDSLTPVMNNKEQTPMANYPITDLSGRISGDRLDLNFKCTILAQGSSVEGLTYTVSSTAYLMPQPTDK